VEGKKSVRTIEEEYGLYSGCIHRLGEGFSWLADSLSAIAESVDWEEKINKDLNKIRMLSNRLVEGVQEEVLNLALLYIPGLSRYHIRSLVGAGYGDENSLRDASEVELGKLLPRRLVQRIQKRMKEDNSHQKVSKGKWIVQDEQLKAFKKAPEECGISGIICETCNRYNVNPDPQKMNISERQSSDASPVASLEPVLEISQLRPDRIIFEGEKIEVTSTEFSLIYLLAQNRGKILTHNDLLDTIWKENEYATYVQITYHLYKIRRVILEIIGDNKKNKERVKDILKVISRRGIMLNLEEEKLKIS
jgi:helicase